MKRSYAKILREEEREGAEKEANAGSVPGTDPIPLELHPERKAMLDHPVSSPQSTARPPTDPEQRVQAEGSYEARGARRHKSKSKPVPFKREALAASQAREEAVARREDREEARRERERKIAERARVRAVMAKARGRLGGVRAKDRAGGGGSRGQRKLGRESGLLLDRVKRIVGA